MFLNCVRKNMLYIPYVCINEALFNLSVTMRKERLYLIISVLDISSSGNLHLRQKDLSKKVTKS